MSHPTVRLTRFLFTHRFGVVPPPDALGVCFVSEDGRTITAEYIFIDDGSHDAEVRELERIYQL